MRNSRIPKLFGGQGVFFILGNSRLRILEFLGKIPLTPKNLAKSGCVAKIGILVQVILVWEFSLGILEFPGIKSLKIQNSQVKYSTQRMQSKKWMQSKNRNSSLEFQFKEFSLGILVQEFQNSQAVWGLGGGIFYLREFQI